MKLLYQEEEQSIQQFLIKAFLMTQSESEYGESQLLEGRWLQDEHHRFLNAIIQHGKDWKIVEKWVKTRTGPQVRSHAQKYFLKLGKLVKEKRKQKSKDDMENSQIENELLDRFREEDMTENTPEEIKVIIGKDWKRKIVHQRKHHQKKIFHKKKNNQQHGLNQQSKQLQPQLFPKISNQSYFIQIIKYNEPHLEERSNLSSLFDFARKEEQNHDEVQEPESQSHLRERTKSFILPGQEQNQDKLKERIQNLHKAMDPSHF